MKLLHILLLYKVIKDNKSIKLENIIKKAILILLI